MRWVSRGLLLAGLTALTAELILQSFALAIDDRSDGSRGGAVTVLCVGDSHTFGPTESALQAYPGRLQQRLDSVAPQHYRVLNLGLPGFNSVQVWNRLPQQVDRHDADMVLVWVGANDSWNLTEVASPSWGARLDGWATKSRLVRLIRVSLYQWRLERELATTSFRDRAELVEQVDGDHLRFRYDGVIESFEMKRREMRADDVMIARATENLAAAADWARDAGIPLAFLTYPAGVGIFAAANTAIRTAASQTGAHVVETARAVEDLPRKHRRLLWGGHPNPAMYLEIAKDVADHVLATLPPPARAR